MINNRRDGGITIPSYTKCTFDIYKLTIVQIYIINNILQHLLLINTKFVKEVKLMSDSINEIKTFFDQKSGETHTLKEWSSIVNIPYNTLYNRVEVYNWPIEKALYEKKYASVNRKPRPKSSYTRMDLTGERFWNLVVIEKSDFSNELKTIWTCECDCGRRVDVEQSYLTSGRKKNCGCHKPDEIISLVGKKFDPFIVSNGPYMNNGVDMWDCACYCGFGSLSHLCIKGDDLRSGKYKKLRLASKDQKEPLEYPDALAINVLFFDMHCKYEDQFIDPSDPYNPYNSLDFRNTMSKEWEYSEFVNFYNWAIENGYKQGMVLKMYDEKGEYGPSNCYLDYPNNKYGQHDFLTYRGVTMTIYQWALYLRISSYVLYERYKNGWSVNDIFEIPVNFESLSFPSSSGEIHTLKEWSEISMIDPITLYRRVYYMGWSIDYSLSFGSPNKDAVYDHIGVNQNFDIFTYTFGESAASRFDPNEYKSMFDSNVQGMTNAIAYVDYFNRTYTPEEWEKEHPKDFN